MPSAESAQPATPPVLAVEGGRATVRLNRPAQHNRIEPDDLRTLLAHLDAVAADPTVRVLVLTGTGRTFCAGYDIGALARGDVPVGDAGTPPQFGDVVDRLEDLDLPTIAALNGGVFGGGTDLALACDFRIGVEGARMFMPAARLGLQYYASGQRRYVERLGLAAAKRLFLAGETLDADAMRSIGYLDEVVPADRLATRVDALAASLAAGAPAAVVGMKRTLNAIARGALDRAAVDAAYAASIRSEDAAEGVRAWHEKRPPVFRGR
ncbi:MAG: enoyl-CoA hydratase/isomerase family protein [Alphaproteobacteria bacterium]|nr:enoyl-CoA hydratase/isomerase family protein [Alphaproteobacteria bacterium]